MDAWQVLQMQVPQVRFLRCFGVEVQGVGEGGPASVLVKDADA